MAHQQPPAPLVWQNGDLVPWPEAKIHVMTSAARYGINVFEGLRGYWSPQDEDLYVFRQADHYRRLAESARVMRFDCPLDPAAWASHLMATVRANGHREDVQVRHTLYLDDFGAAHTGTGPIGEFVATTLGGRPAGWERGIRLAVSSWTRIDDRDMPPRVKAGSNYQNGRLASLQARADGYEGVVMLDRRGKVAEAPGACVGIVRRGSLVTPPVTGAILESVTRATLLELAERELELPVIEREIDRTELYVAEEVFLCGTAAEVTPVVAVDGLAVGQGAVGPVTRALQDLYMKVVRGEHPAYRQWLTPVYRS